MEVLLFSLSGTEALCLQLHPTEQAVAPTSHALPLFACCMQIANTLPPSTKHNTTQQSRREAQYTGQRAAQAQEQQRPDHSCGKNGFSIRSLPSTGEMSVSMGPRATTRPSSRVCSTPSSSSPSARYISCVCSIRYILGQGGHAAKSLFDVVKNKVQQLVVAF